MNESYQIEINNLTKKFEENLALDIISLKIKRRKSKRTKGFLQLLWS